MQYTDVSFLTVTYLALVPPSAGTGCLGALPHLTMSLVDLLYGNMEAQSFLHSLLRQSGAPRFLSCRSPLQRCPLWVLRHLVPSCGKPNGAEVSGPLLSSPGWFLNFVEILSLLSFPREDTLFMWEVCSKIAPELEECFTNGQKIKTREWRASVEGGRRGGETRLAWLIG